tara:strand:- start:306 stop:566 length:261 start_codon:yes stop_codon:yes gene_type:complete
MAFKMNYKGFPTKDGESRKEKRQEKKLARLDKKGKLIGSEYMKSTGEGVYEDWDSGETFTDPKGVVTGENSTQYKVSKKGKIKKEV